MDDYNANSNIPLVMYNEMENEMNRYPNLPTPPMSGSEGSQSPRYTTYDVAACFVHIPQFHNLTLTEESCMDNIKLQIIEQPVEKFRFRYKSEMAGTHGSLSGQSTEKNRKVTYPTVKVLNCNCNEPVVVRCALYQFHNHLDKQLWQPHAHRLVQKLGPDEVDDPHDKEVSRKDEYTAVFNNMGIIHTARKYLVDEIKKKKIKLKQEEILRTEQCKRELRLQESLDIEKKASEESKSINLNTACLRFDAFIRKNDILYPICPPVFSHSINNLKSALTGELKIVRMDRCTSPATGGKEVYLLVEKVTKKNIKVRFFEMDDEENEAWSCNAHFNDIDVHHQYAIVIKTPPYKVTNIESDRKVFIELFRPTDGATSTPMEFTYYPDRAARRKRPRTNYDTSASFSSSDCPLPLNDMLPEIRFSSGDISDFVHGVNSDQFLEIFPKLEQLMGNSNCVPEQIQIDTACIQAEPNMEILTESEYRSHRELRKTDEELLKRSAQEMFSLIKTKPTSDRIIKMLQKLLKQDRNPEGNNGLHLAFSQQKSGKYQKYIDLFLDLIATKQHNLLNIQNNYGDTVLHVALNNADNEPIHQFHTLVQCTTLSIKNDKGRTPLHLAVMSNNGYERIVNSKMVKTFIDIQNNDGHTAIQIAVSKDNLKALQALCNKGADISVVDGRNGANLLHMAIEDGYKELVNYLLKNTRVNVDGLNFKDLNCQMLAKRLENSSEAHKAICAMIEDHLKIIGRFQEIFIKEEVESDDDMEGEDVPLKLEPMSEDEIKESYGAIAEFTPDCLQQVSNILDKSDKWKGLPVRLDLDFVLCPNLFEKDKYPTKSFMKLALAKGVSVFQIRMALQDMGEILAFQCIDRMVLESCG